MKIRAVRAVLTAAMGCAALAFATPASAGAVSREGFHFVDGETSKIVVFRPDVHVGSLRVGGIDEPNAEWTETARANMQKALVDAAARENSQLIFLDELEGENADLLDTYRGLFEAVAGAMALHATGPDRLPTKTVKVEDPVTHRTTKQTRVDWTLGDGTGQLRDITGADYAMFVFTHDAYGDAGRKVAQVLAAGLFGVYVPAGIHIGYAGLVDLRTGDVVWFNTDFAMGGDPREVDGAQKRVGQLLEGFPQQQPAALSEEDLQSATPPEQESQPEAMGDAEAAAPTDSALETQPVPQTEPASQPDSTPAAEAAAQTEAAE